jgi:malonyl CoA-acyl carrier protein transacylase
MKAVVFPGQGAQKKGMGAELFDRVSEFTTAEAQIDQVLGYSVRRLCLSDPWDRLRQTQFTQPALYIVNALHFFDLKSRGLQPDYLAGHSLGEYNALLAANAFDLLTGVRIVMKRGELMARAKNGGMAAVIGMSSTAVADLMESAGLQDIDIANYNAPSQVVISGPVDKLEAAEATFLRAGASLFVKLPVSAAFHSRYMIRAADEFGAFLETIAFRRVETAVIANTTAKPYPTDADPSAAIRSLLAGQMRSPVRWTESVQFLLQCGVTHFEEAGPGTVLTKLIQQIKQSPTAMPH